MTLRWNNITVRLGDLKAWGSNPRQSTKAQAKKLIESFEEFGQVETIAVSPELEVYNGHQRLSALLTIHGKDYEIDARQASRALTEQERKKLTIFLHAGATGSWDWDTLSGWDASEIIEWGFDEPGWKIAKTDAAAWGELLKSEQDGEDDKYTRNIQAPIYEPKGDKPEIKDLYDYTRANELIAEIDKSELPENEKEFLRAAARRHTVFNYKNIAEYYAHSDVEMQRLMENSALVIIDFNKAIELGYVKLSEEVAEQFKEDYPDA